MDACLEARLIAKAEQQEERLIATAEQLYACAVIRPPLASNYARVYRCRQGQKTFILKAISADLQSPAHVLGTLSFVTHLREHGVPAPAPVPSITGELVETVELGGGPHTLWAIEELPGARVDWRHWTPVLFQQWGALLGSIHALAKGFSLPPGAVRPVWRDEWAMDYRSIPAEYTRVREQADALYERLRSLPEDGDGFGIGHADLHQENFFLDGSALLPFDFDNCLYNWFIADFSPILHNALLAQRHHYQRGEYAYWAGGQPMDGPTFTAHFLGHFWNGYQGEHDLDPEWLLRLPDFFLRRHLSVWAERVTSGPASPGSFPWRPLARFTREVEDTAWIDALFAPALRQLLGPGGR
ncbi:MAG: phosphotransferase [Dehalococcoidia bacterium]